MQIQVAQILLQILNFTILILVLTRFLYKPLLEIMAARSKKIQDGLEAAEKSLEEQVKTEEKRKHIVTQAEKEAADILDQARVEAKQAGKDIVAQAKKEAQESVEKEYAILKAKLLEEEQKVRHNIASLVSETTQTVLKGALNDKAHKQIIKKQISELSSLKN